MVNCKKSLQLPLLLQFLTGPTGIYKCATPLLNTLCCHFVNLTW